MYKCAGILTAMDSVCFKFSTRQVFQTECNSTVRTDLCLPEKVYPILGPTYSERDVIVKHVNPVQNLYVTRASLRVCVCGCVSVVEMCALCFVFAT